MLQYSTLFWCCALLGIILSLYLLFVPWFAAQGMTNHPDVQSYDEVMVEWKGCIDEAAKCTNMVCYTASYGTMHC